MLRRGRKFLCSIDQARSSGGRQKSGVLALRNALNYRETGYPSRNNLCACLTLGQDRTILGTVRDRSQPAFPTSWRSYEISRCWRLGYLPLWWGWLARSFALQWPAVSRRDPNEVLVRNS